MIVHCLTPCIADNYILVLFKQKISSVKKGINISSNQRFHSIIIDYQWLHSIASDYDKEYHFMLTHLEKV